MNTDDPKLTAYALGELDAAECAAMEAALRDDPQARAHVAELRAFTGLLGRELKEEAPETMLGLEQRHRVIAAGAVPEPPARRVRLLPGNTMEWLRMAALLALGLLPIRYIAQQTSPGIADPGWKAAGRGEWVEPDGGVEGMPSEPVDAQSPAAGPALAAAPVTDTVSTGWEMPMPPPTATVPSAEVKPLARETLDLKARESIASLEKRKEQDARAGAGRLTRDQVVSTRHFTHGRGANSRGAAAIRSSDNDWGNTEAYAAVEEQPFFVARENPLSTFGVDVDTASYSNVRRFLNQGRRPPVGAVRIEELLNYFPYAYAPPGEGEGPFKANVEVGECPWNPEHQLVRVGLKGREVAAEKRPPGNLVFLIDSSGSMSAEDKMPLLKASMRLLVGQLREEDTVSIVTYAGAAGLVLAPTSGADKKKILEALDGLSPSGSTNGAGGIRLAYETARAALEAAGGKRASRVILASDGDFNVGVTDESELVRLIEKEAKDGIFLTILGFGQGNLKDATMEKIANRGNGQYAYIDSLREGHKVLVEQVGGTLETIAKDVKVQVEFNPAQVGSYRLIGYENRALRKEDFNDDRKDAGEIGAGHTVTALYEVIPAGREGKAAPEVDPLRYQPQAAAPTPAPAVDERRLHELLTVKLRYKEPDGETSRLTEIPVPTLGRKLSETTQDFRFAAAVAQFGMLLRHSSHSGNATWESTLELASEGVGNDPGGYRAEFLELVRGAGMLKGE